MTADGLLIVDKPSGATSADIVRVVKRTLRCKTGHLGTLDPFATGVLPLCLGEGTKLAPFLNEEDKEYEGVLRLGKATDTGDLTGATVAEAEVPVVAGACLDEVAFRFRGESMQVPPMYSAIKHQGVPLYRLARRGVEVEREARPIEITSLSLWPRDGSTIGFRVECSKGTYVRVLAEDIARALGTVGHLETLRRTRFGPFGIDQAVGVESVASQSCPVIGLRESLRGMREVTLDAVASVRARGGYEPVLRSLESGQPGEHAKLIDPHGELVAVVVSQASRGWRFARVFAASVPPSPALH